MVEGPQIPNDWPANLTVPVVSPLAYLRVQAAKLGEMTRGLVIGDVTTTTADGCSWVSHGLWVVCPAVEGYQAEVLTVRHRQGRPYPVRIEAREFIPYPDDPDPDADMVREADDYDGFRELVRTVLKSSSTVSLVQSLLAQSTDAKLAAS